ncbi:MAG: PAS domain-containing protein [Planctomycetes bacterium]|nr:PAS domain-containing protein [Planctomycetota bacterium]
MKTRENLKLSVMCAWAFSLFAAVLAAWSYLDYAGDKRLSTLTLHAVSICSTLWIGWYCLKLFGTFREAIELVKQGKFTDIKSTDNQLAGELFQTIKNRITGYLGYISELEKQIENFQIKLRLLRKLKHNTDTIISQIPDPVIVVDEFDKLIIANHAAGKLFNFDLENSKYKSIDELITTPCFVDQFSENKKDINFVDLLQQNKQNKCHPVKCEVIFADKDNGNKYFDCSLFSICHDGGKPWGIVAILHDITRKKQIDKLKNDFVGHVSHELKTPLASITAYSEMLVDNDVKDEKTKNQFYSVIQKQAKRLNQLIDEMWDTSRVESGMIKIKKQSFSLQALIAEQLQMIRGYAQQKKINIIEPDNTIIFGPVYADRDMIAQVITNLLTNAVKYTKPEGSITVEIDIDEAENLARVTVADTGIGIQKDQIEAIFDKYYRANTNEHAEQGLGLGLNLVKQIVEKLHDGHVFVDSKPEVGSTFGFELPLTKAEEIEQPQRSEFMEAM